MICPTCHRDVDLETGHCVHCQAETLTSSPLRFLNQLDAVFAVVCLAAMILIVVFQILARNLFHTGIIGVDVLVRHLVLWVVFCGASVATRQNRHIHIDILPRFLSPTYKTIAGGLVTIFSLAVSGVLAYASVAFVLMEKESGLLLAPLGAPLWMVEIIIPAGYALIALHFAIGGLFALLRHKAS